jgi:REP element-mobilizing transposase RayT
MRLDDGGQMVQTVWEELLQSYPNDIELDAFVIMPNHVHGIILFNDINDVGAIHELPLQQDRIYRRRMLIPKIIGRFKMKSAKHINEIRATPGTPLWQRNYFEHIIRDENE